MTQSINDKIKENHIIFLTSGMDAKATNEAILDIMSWNKASKDIEINLYISACSLDFINTMALYDVLNSIDNPIAAYCLGHVGGFSTAFITLAKPGKRYALKHTVISLNQPMGMIQTGVNQQTEVEIEAIETSKQRKVFEELLAKALNKPFDEIHQLVEIDKEFIASEAKEYGFIDEVLE